ncbi:hypothetical protein [Roseibium aggregatum]|uniref:Uncharacterized protein n=1 Tax=Roseibium aggregatum TaxID=187304 RepID=A0A939J2W7_9HYPH|nr:hypothetical protein [Roseibium aggregatum]MBN9669972.1 hypothetical protein [Roseibium aggregatum]
MPSTRKSIGPVKLPRDPLFRLLLINGVAGVFIAALVLGGIFLANIGNLRVLVMSAENPILPVIMLAFGLVITLGSVVMGSAIMLVGEDDRDGGKRRGGKKMLMNNPALRPVPAVATAGHLKHLHR